MFTDHNDHAVMQDSRRERGDSSEQIFSKFTFCLLHANITDAITYERRHDES